MHAGSIPHAMNTNSDMKVMSVFIRDRENSEGRESRADVSPGQHRPTARDSLVVTPNVGPPTRWGRRDACPALAAPPPGALSLKCLAVVAVCSLPLFLAAG